MSANINHPFTRQVQPHKIASNQAARLERDVAAFEAMCKARPLKPPPLRLQPRLFSSGELALRRDMKLGAL